MMIDTHTHCGHADTNNGKYIPPHRSAWFDGVETKEQYIAAVRKNGIERIIIVDIPELAFPMREQFGDFVIPIPMINMNRATPEYLEELFTRGAAGIKFISPLKSYGNDSFMPLYEVVDSHRALAVFHTGYVSTGFYEPGCIKDVGGVVDVTDMRPMALDRIVRYFPNLKVQLAHMGNPWWEEAWCMITSHKNIYADFSGRPPARSLTMWADLFAPDGKLDEKAVSKLCFGSDAQYLWPGNHDPSRKYINFYERFYECLNLSQELRDKINFGNIQELLEHS